MILWPRSNWLQKSSPEPNFSSKNYLVLFTLFFLFCVDLNFTHGLECPANTWPCNNSVQCINITQKCDGKVDCQDCMSNDKFYLILIKK
jgi:hypothetical protein